MHSMFGPGLDRQGAPYGIFLHTHNLAADAPMTRDSCGPVTAALARPPPVLPAGASACARCIPGSYSNVAGFTLFLSISVCLKLTFSDPAHSKGELLFLSYPIFPLSVTLSVSGTHRRASRLSSLCDLYLPFYVTGSGASESAPCLISLLCFPSHCLVALTF